MDDRYILILTELYNKGISVEMEITEIMYSLYTNQPDLPANQVWDGVKHDINNMLKLLLTNKHIKYREQPYRAEDTQGKITETPHIYAEITFEGFNYLDNHRLIKSTEDLNESTKITNKTISDNSKTQTNIFIFQSLVFVCGAAFACGSLIVSCNDKSKDDEIKLLKSHISALQKDSTKSHNLLLKKAAIPPTKPDK